MRTSLVLGFLALALLAFIVVFERGSVTTTERDQRKGRVLDSFVRDRVTVLEIQRKGVTTRLWRGADKTNALGLGAWQVSTPYTAKADTEAVDNLLGDLEWIDAKRTLSDLKPADAQRFGLDKPRYRVAFEVGNAKLSFTLGTETPQGDGVYMQLADPRQAYVVGKNVASTLDHEPAEYHTKELHEGVSIYATRKLSLADAHGERIIDKRGDQLWLSKPQETLASEPAVSAIVNALDGLRATRYVTDDKAQLASYGLAAPITDLSLELRNYDEKAKDKFSESTLRFRIGSSCNSHVGESYVMAQEGPVMCAADAELQKLRKPTEELREARALPLDDADIHGVNLRVGEAELALEQKDDSWTYRSSTQGQQKASGAVDPAALADWFKALRAVTALRFDPGVAPTLDAGLTNASVVASFIRAKGSATYELRLGRAELDQVAAGRSGDHSVLWFPQALHELLSASVSRFRKPRLLEEPQASFVHLALVRADGTREAVTKDASGYHFQGPVQASCERSVVDEIVRLVSALEAVRFAADAARPEHGLQHPQWTLTLGYRDPAAATGSANREHTLKLGAASSDGRYAQLDSDPAVFVVSPVLLDQLEQPLVSRSALATPVEELLSLSIEQGANTLRIEHAAGSAPGFVMAGASAATSPRADGIARTLATLRASALAPYGKPTPEQGFDHPQARITVRQKLAAGERSRTLLIGKAGAAGVFARDQALDLTFTLPSDAVEALLARNTVAHDAAPALAPAP